MLGPQPHSTLLRFHLQSGRLTSLAGSRKEVVMLSIPFGQNFGPALYVVLYSLLAPANIVLSQILGWAGFVKVDGVAYSFLGAPAVSGATFSQATQQSFSVIYLSDLSRIPA